MQEVKERRVEYTENAILNLAFCSHGKKKQQQQQQQPQWRRYYCRPHRAESPWPSDPQTCKLPNYVSASYSL